MPFYEKSLGKTRGEPIPGEEGLLRLLQTPNYDGVTATRIIRHVKCHGVKFLPETTFRPDLTHGVRSNWEANFARWLWTHGIEYDYETARFALSDGLWYVPDFLVPVSWIWIEVKGLWMPKAKKKVDRFLTDYPDERLVVLDEEVYKMLTPVGGWE